MKSDDRIDSVLKKVTGGLVKRLAVEGYMVDALDEAMKQMVWDSKDVLIPRDPKGNARLLLYVDSGKAWDLVSWSESSPPPFGDMKKVDEKDVLPNFVVRSLDAAADVFSIYRDRTIEDIQGTIMRQKDGRNRRLIMRDMKKSGDDWVFAYNVRTSIPGCLTGLFKTQEEMDDWYLWDVCCLGGYSFLEKIVPRNSVEETELLKLKERVEYRKSISSLIHQFSGQVGIEFTYREEDKKRGEDWERLFRIPFSLPEAESREEFILKGDLLPARTLEEFWLSGRHGEWQDVSGMDCGSAG